MTRFARAKGSKASNERVPEMATSWTEMRQQLDAVSTQASDEKHQKDAESKRRANYNKFLEEHQTQGATSAWAEIPERGGVTLSAPTDSTESVSAKIKGKPEGKRKRKRSAASDLSKGAEADVESIYSVPERPVRLKHVLKRRKVAKAAPQASESAESIETLKPKKKPEDMSESERKLYEKKKLRKRLYVEKRKRQKRELRAQQELDKPATVVVAPAQPKKQAPKVRDPNKEHKRRKPRDDSVQHVTINGKAIELVHYDGFPVKQEDAVRLRELRKAMISKGLPRSEVAAAMKLERRRAEKSLARDRKNVCYKCRRAGHVLSECPELLAGDDVEGAASGICFKCGSTEHTHFECRVVKQQEFKYATCFVCKEAGHISWQCPDNARGLYPKGGACNVCGDVTHLKKDCPRYVAEQEAQALHVDRMGGDNPDAIGGPAPSDALPPKNPVNKIVKF